MMYPVMMAAYNRTPAQLELTKRSLESVMRQDVGKVDILVINNGSDEATGDWLQGLPWETDEYRLCVETHIENQSPCVIANHAMADRFGRMKYEYILGVANDAILLPNFYRELLKWPRGIVTASMTSEDPLSRIAASDHDCPGVHESQAEVVAVSEHTPMAVALIRRWAYDAVVAKDGFFLDEGFFHYCSDCDLALRIASCGIRGVQLSLPYYHYCSASHRLSTPEVERQSNLQADIDRERFKEKWGFAVDAYEYGACAADLNFKG